MEEEWEEEEQLVVVELSGIINNEHLSKCLSTCKILDIDSERPMMQVGQYVFAGEYEDTLGTCVLFEEVPHKGKAADSPDLKYMCHTAKKLTMQRVFLTEKKEGERRTECGDGEEQTDTTCRFNEENNETQTEETDKDMDNTALNNSPAS
uniref:Transcription factor TFIIIC triple barrel domain-containing protein n=2 Tax=Salarias fasciatus TaxID=181472 RepID=A0A672IIN7_SALFA